MWSSESIASDTEYADHVHESLKYAAIYEPGTFSCSSPDDDVDDDDDDVDVKRILAEHGGGGGGLDTSDCESVGFSSAYKAAAAAAAADEEQEADGEASADVYEHWDEALRDATAVYPPLGAGRPVTAALISAVPEAGDVTSRWPTTHEAGHRDDDNDDYDSDRTAAARELRKCLEGALYGRDAEEFAVAQPYCVADKNLDFGKPEMSHKVVNESRKKVEDWMSKHLM